MSAWERGPRVRCQNTFHPISHPAKRSPVKTTRYFDEQVLRKRPYIRREWCEAALADPGRREAQADGRYRLWFEVLDTPDGKSRMLRVIVLEDGETVHNAFFDRDFR